MVKKLNTIVDFNRALIGSEIKILEVGNRTAYNDSPKAQADAKEFPTFIKAQIVEDPAGLNTDAEFHLKLRNADGIKAGQQFQIGKGGYKVVGGQLTFWSNRTRYHGRDWIFTNVAVKGDRFDAWD
jgi:hypothetical protein